MDAEAFEATLRRAPTREDRLAWFGALLGSEARTQVQLVGRSAIEVYLSADVFVSQDVDVVGDRRALAEVLLRWGFKEIKGRSRRVYWFKESLGLIDLVGAVARSGLPPRRVDTPVGPVLLSALEPLIIRRLMRSEREGSNALFRQAVRLGRLGSLDWDYIEAEAKYEQLNSILERFRLAISRPLGSSRRGPKRSKGARKA